MLSLSSFFRLVSRLNLYSLICGLAMKGEQIPAKKEEFTMSLPMKGLSPMFKGE